MNKPTLSRRASLALHACVLAGILISTSSTAHADKPDFLGPIETTNQRPYQLLFLAFPPQSADVLSKGRRSTAFKIDFGFDYLNPSPGFGAVVKEETETDRVEYEESLGLGKGWQAAVSVPVVWRNGGFLGALVGPYHDMIHFNDPTIDAWQGRGHDALFHSVIYDQRADGTVAVNAGPAFGLGDTSLYLKKAVWNSRNGHTNLAARAGLKLPTGSASELLGSGGVDGGYDVDLSQEITRKLALHANYSRIWMQHPTKLDNDANTVTAYTVAMELHLHHSASWIVQTEGTETTFRTGNTFADGAPRIAGVGYKWTPKPNTLWTLAFTEGGDYQTFHWPGVSNIGPDFVITIDMVRTH
jgi:hypothetical protein